MFEFFVISDLDNTLTVIKDRLRHIENGKKDWDAFHSECFNDELNKPVAEILRRFLSTDKATSGKYWVEIWTGRPERHRPETEDWLSYYNIVPNVLRMRGENDKRPDIRVKGDWLKDCWEIDRMWPDLVLDDRTHAVNWWRNQGITCLQVAQNDF